MSGDFFSSASNSADPILDPLNERQRQAVLATKGPVLIVAGAGAGKTKALTHRIAHLVRDCGASPHQILAVTFTNKAAAEMKARLNKMLGTNLDPSASLAATFWRSDSPTVGTFHAICVQILRREIQELGREKDFLIYDAADQRALMRQIFDELHIDDKAYNPRAVLGAISSAKSSLIGPDTYAGDGDFGRLVAEVYPRYQKRLLENNALDFDDLLNETVRLFRSRPNILEKYQDRWLYISIDEYQDTNAAQDAITTMLAEKYRNLCVIGDPDQSIYSWRGADISNIRDFRRRYPEAVEVLLEQNYRSTKTILAAANAAIRHNSGRQEKNLWTDGTDGSKIVKMQLGDERMEAEFIANEIARRVRESRNSHSDFTILYRTNAQSRVLEETFLRHGIPHRIIGGVKFYERKEVRDVLAYLRLIQNPADNLSLLRVINVPTRGIGPKTIEVLQAFATERGSSLTDALEHAVELPIPDSKRLLLAKFALGMQKLRQLNRTETAAGLIKNVIAKIKLREYYEAEGKVEAETRMENILELINVASKYDALEPGLSLATFLEEVTLLTDADQAEAGEQAVLLMTLHTSKGLEFPVVFLVGLEEGIFPHSRSSLDPRELEEERRLFYVGITRAEKELFLTSARSRMYFGEINMNAPSQFLETIPKELLAEESTLELKRRGYGERELPDESAPLPSYEVGDRVRHASFGTGIIRSIRGSVAEIEFPAGLKKLALSIAPLEKID